MNGLFNELESNNRGLLRNQLNENQLRLEDNNGNQILGIALIVQHWQLAGELLQLGADLEHEVNYECNKQKPLEFAIKYEQ